MNRADKWFVNVVLQCSALYLGPELYVAVVIILWKCCEVNAIFREGSKREGCFGYFAKGMYGPHVSYLER
jgi:hypothetical protein